MKQITKDIYQITVPTPFLVGPVNSYLIKGDALTLVDTGPKTDEASISLKIQLAELNLSMEDIDMVLLTHHHPDHIGLVEEFSPNAKIYAHPKVRPWLKQENIFLKQSREFYQNLYKSHGVPEDVVQIIDKSNTDYLRYSASGDVDVELLEGSMIDGLPEWTVLETPGHAQSHISLYREKDGLMISGDHLIEHISSNAIIEAPYQGETERPNTLLQYRDSLRKCLHVDLAYSGHGVPVTSPQKLIQHRLEEQDRKADVFKELMGQGPVTCFQLCEKKYGRIYKKQPTLTLSETLGHLDLLEKRGDVRVSNVDGLIYYESI